jgi:hypothetical protein
MTLPLNQPRIDYLARDYTSLRQMLLDRLSVQIPTWTERHVADLEIALVELLAYAGDYLSYYQDAVAAEAYLMTARQRISQRRHARLLDYAIDEGLNARAFVHIGCTEDNVLIPAHTPLLTDSISSEPALPLETLNSYDGMVFETMHPVELFRASNHMVVEAEASGAWTLPAGRTELFLRGDMQHLRQGDLLLLHHVPTSGHHAVPHAGHIVRLTEAPLPVNSSLGRAATRIVWSHEDALPFPLPVASQQVGGHVHDGQCIVRGNLVLADEGRTVTETLLPVPRSGTFQPRLIFNNIAHAVPFSIADLPNISASALAEQDAQKARALIQLVEQIPAPGSAIAASLPARLLGLREWTSRRDLLGSSRFARDFVAEIDNDGRPVLRFGDDVHGRKPQPGMVFEATCRVGQGSAGNIGAGVIQHIVLDDPRILSVSNPLPAVGGTDPELADEIRTNAPAAFRAIQFRCITTDDYVRMAQQIPGVQSARATRTWPVPAQPWLAAVKVYLVPTSHQEPWEQFEQRCASFLNPFVKIGDVLSILPAKVQQIRLRLNLRVAEGYSSDTVCDRVRGAIQRQIAVTSFAFGQTVYASSWVAVAALVPGVDAVEALQYSAFENLPQRSIRADDDTFVRIDELQVEHVG